MVEDNGDFNREIPAETSESDDEMEAEDKGDHLQGAEDVTFDEDVQEAQMQDNVPANLRRRDRWGNNIYDL